MKQLLLSIITLACIMLANTTFAKHNSKTKKCYKLLEKLSATNTSTRKTRSGIRLLEDSTYNYTAGIKTYTSKYDYKYKSNYGYDITAEELSIADGQEYIDFIYSLNNHSAQVHLYDTSYYTNANGQIQFSRIYNFNPQHNKTEHITNNYMSGVLTPSYKQVYTLDANNKIVQEDAYSWISGTWVYQSKYTFQYNNNQLIEKVVNQDWNTNTLTWDSTEYSMLAYNANNLLTHLHYFERNTANTGWDNSERYLFTYNTNNKLSSFTTEFWDGTTWNNDVRETYTYNTNNQLIHLDIEQDNMGTWVLYDKLDFNYLNTTDKYCSSYIAQTFNGSTFDNSEKRTYTFIQPNVIESMSAYSWTNSAWTIYSSKVYKYNTFTPASSKVIMEENAIAVYPNPTSANIYILTPNEPISTYAIYNTSGQLVMQGKLSKNNNSLNVTKLTAGYYILSLQGTTRFNTTFTKL